MRGHVVYIHKRPDTGDVFYVGIGSTRGRAYDENTRSKEWKEIVNEFYFDVEILAHGLTRELAGKLEIDLIDHYGYENLVNKTLGGYGVSVKKRSKKEILSISKSLAARNRPRKSIEKTIQTRRERHSFLYMHKRTGEVILGLKWACQKYGVNYKKEHKRQKNSPHLSDFKIMLKETIELGL